MSRQASSSTQELPRIAIIWPAASMHAERAYHAICRLNDRGPRVTLRRFDIPPSGTTGSWLKIVRTWKPHGVLFHTERWDLVRRLRGAVPAARFVATLMAPPDLADTCVVSDIGEIIEHARDHFLSRGVNNVALYCSAGEHAVAGRTAAFRAAVPRGFELVFGRGGTAQGRKVVSDWLGSLPKPVGIVAPEAVAGCFLLCCCTELGIRVPQDVQIIGVDDADECLAQTPHLTSFELPSRRIGEVALETMLRCVRAGPPKPPGVLYVPGCRLVVRGSTGRVRSGKSATAIAIRQMQGNPEKDLTVDRLARLAGVSRTTFYRQFSEASGTTPARHIRQMRLQMACRRLRDSAATVATIAQECGFSSLIYFTQFFRREMGETPGAYRERMRGKG